MKIDCGLGLVKGGEYYYTDCCGNFITGTVNPGESLQVSFNYNLASGNVETLEVTSSIVCGTPTPTPTPTITPTNTVTPTVTPTNTTTPTPSIAPSVTPSNTPVTRLKNECDVITLFNMGISCNVIQSPTDSNPSGGVLSLNVTGGTAPYTFLWSGGQRSQTLFGVPVGSYEVVVVDYYGDYTATTICGLFGPTPTPTHTMTPTPSQTPPVKCVDLCLIAIGGVGIPNFGPIQFVCDGTQNGRFKWTSGDYDIIWNINNSRWEIYVAGTTTPYVLNGGGILASTTFDLIPDSAWTVLGGTEDYSVTMTKGNCPTVIPLQVSIDKTNSSCQGTANCNGSISILAQDGYPPYVYSINGGVTNSSDYAFTNLCPNTYSVVVTDSQNNTQTSSMTIGYDSTPVTYQLSLSNVGVATTTSVPNVSQTVTQQMTLVSNPPLPVGVSVTFNLLSTALITVNGPGSGTSSVIFNVTKNGSPITTTVGATTTVSQGNRPFCSPNTQTVTSTDYSSSITITNGDVINITSTTVDTITNGQVASQSNCTTNIINQVSAVISTPTIIGNNCSSVIGSSRQVQTNDFTYVPTIINECENCVAHDVVIGTQTWDGCNLNVSTYRNGDPIPQVTDPAEWVGLTTGAWCYYDNNITNDATYGKLYNWFAVNDPRGLAPTGYSIPSGEEWDILINYLGGPSVAGGKLKEEGLCHWLTPNTDATNDSNFTALPGGFRYPDGNFLYVGINGQFWTSTPYLTTAAYVRNIGYLYGVVSTVPYDNNFGYSVRCLKTSSPTPPTPPVLQPGLISVIEPTFLNIACSFNMNTNCWISGTGDISVGDVVYTNAAGTTRFIGSGYYKTQLLIYSDSYKVNIANNGTILEIQVCN